MGTKIYASAYLRPSTREVFEESFSVISFSGDSCGVDESMSIYWSDYVWEEFSDLDSKGLYKFEAILDLTFTHYAGWDYSEYSEDLHVDNLLLLDKAEDFAELRYVVTRLLNKPERTFKLTDRKTHDLSDLFRNMK